MMPVHERGGRARYLVQVRDPVTLDVPPGSTQWSHYQGNTIYGDYTVNATNTGFDEGRRYLPGVTHLDPDPADPTILNPEFVHADQVGSMRALTDDLAAFTREVIYTSFGDVVSTTGSSNTRYGYVGASAYEEGLLPGWGFVHVGARWYDQSTGRFLQRDPIGIGGGLNVYLYALGRPTSGIDPSGNGFWDGNNWFHDVIARYLMQESDIGPLELFHDVEASLILLGPGMVGAGIGDAMLMGTGLTWWYDGEGGNGEVFYCTRRILKMVEHEWKTPVRF